MPEQQNIEYKQSWHDDYLKWVCGFANAQGGIIYIGKDDNGKVLGVADYKKLLEDLPNKIRDILGIMVDVNLLEEAGLFYLEIITHPYIVPISLRGRYYYRSGSTKQELIGTALTDFLLRKTGKSWDEVIEPTASLQDIDEQSLAIFISASLKAGRITDVEGLSTAALLSKLRLTDDKGNIKRAAIVLFGKNVDKFYNNCIVKVGKFKSNEEELMFQELEEGNIIQLLKEIPSQLNRKFFIKPISFEGLQRIEKGEYPVAAIREMLLNALVHRNYLGTVVQIRVYDNSINIWNEGLLPEGLSLNALKRQHPSRPRNQLIADVCFKGGYIDTWGRGTLKIINACLEAELPEPEILEQDGGILVTLFKNKYSAEQLKKMNLNGRQLGAVFYLLEKGSITNKEYQEISNISRQTATRDLKELVEKFKIFKREGITGSGTSYILNDS
jgi:ATP-dependent DNA helicase RecG